MIPKVIHQTWKTHILPDNVRKLHNKIKQLHPEWNVKLWSDADNLVLVEEYFPHLLDLYQALPYNIMRVDIVRYMYMFQFGGYYLDLDYEVLTPFDNTTSEADLLLPISNTENGCVILGNSIFGSIPNHIFWKDLLENLQNNPPVKKFYNKFEVLKLTGPDFISSIYFKNPEKYHGNLVPKNIYHPDNTLINHPNYRTDLRNIGTRGIHHCQGSWLKENNSILNIISRANSSVKRRLYSMIK